MKAVLQCTSVYTVSQHDRFSVFMIQLWKDILCKTLKLFLYLPMKSRHITKTDTFSFRIQINIFRFQDQLTGIQKILGHFFHDLYKASQYHLKRLQIHLFFLKKRRHGMPGSYIIIHHEFSVDSLYPALKKIRHSIGHDHSYLVRICIDSLISCQDQIIMIHIPFIFRSHFMASPLPAYPQFLLPCGSIPQAAEALPYH